jgi:hypothetical protein
VSAVTVAQAIKTAGSTFARAIAVGGFGVASIPSTVDSGHQLAERVNPRPRKDAATFATDGRQYTDGANKTDRGQAKQEDLMATL